jgi:hypothetical protein
MNVSAIAAGSSSVRRRAFAALLAVVAVAPFYAASVAAQPPSGTTTTAVLIPENGATLGHTTSVSMGLRRGAGDVEGLRYVYSGELLARRNAPEELYTALDELDAIAEEVRGGNPNDAQRRADAAVVVFEDNLDLVSRTHLVDAHMLAALAQCQRRRQRECVSGFEYVLSFREGVEYDLERYPADFYELFEETRVRLLTDGARGSLEVTTEPAGAEVFVDGRSLGPAPATGEALLAGAHYVTVRALGYRELIVRVEVGADRTSRVTLPLEEAGSALLLRQNLPRIRRELGQPTAGPAIRGIDGYLPVNQIMLGVISPAAVGRLSVSLYLYDLRTNFLLSHRDTTLALGDAAGEASAQLARDLYDGVDLSGAVEAPDDRPDFDSTSIFETWWFWTAVGVVLVSGVVVATQVGGGEPGIPSGFTRLSGQVQ